MRIGQGGGYVIRKYCCKNGVVEKVKFWVPAGVVVRSGRVKGNTGAAKRDANARSAVRTLARLLNCNYTSRDLLLNCKFDNQHITAVTSHKEMDRLVKNFLDRLKRALKAAGVKENPKIVVVPSDIDGKTGRPARPHVHIVITGEGFRFDNGRWLVGERVLDDIWGMGSIYAENLYDQPDYTPLALYLIRQGRTGADEKKYKPSRNMAKPIITETVARSGAAMRQPARALLLESGEYHEEMGCHYIRYVPVPKRENMSNNGTPIDKRGDILRHDLR